MNVTAIIAAAGSGTRLGADKPKALVKLAGEPLLVHSVRSMHEAGIVQVVVTVPAGDTAAQEECARVLADAGIENTILTPGGASRQESVSQGLAAALKHFPDTSHVLIHDAARALTPADMIQRVTGLLAVGAPAVIPVLPVIDTIKRIEPDPDAAQVAHMAGTRAEGCADAGRDKVHASMHMQYQADSCMPARPAPAVVSYTENVRETLDRSTLRAVQTPQGFESELLQRAHKAGAELSADEVSAAPDDAALVELIGEPVRTVPGDERALKITTPFDLEFAQWLIERS